MAEMQMPHALAAANKRHISPLNTPDEIHQRMDFLDRRYRCKVLWRINLLRMLFMLALLITLPTFISRGAHTHFIWQSFSLTALWYSLVSGVTYLAIFGCINYMLQHYCVKPTVLLINACLDALLLFIFFLFFKPIENWTIVVFAGVSSFFLSLMTLSFWQCIFFSIYLLLLRIVSHLVWIEFFNPEVTSSFFQRDWASRYHLIQENIFNVDFSLGEPLYIFVLLCVLLALMGYLVSQSRENKIRAGINATTAQQLRLLNETVFSDLSTPLIIVNLRGRLIAVNRQARALLLIQSNRALPVTLQEACPELAEKEVQWRELMTGAEEPLVIGSKKYSVEFTYLAIKDFAPLVMISLNDMDAIYQHVREERLIALGRLTAGIAHEIRNPLGSIQSANELIAESTNKPEIRYLSNKIANNSLRINAIISDILNMFSVSNQPRELFELNPFLHSTVRNSRNDDALEGVPIEFQLKATIGYSVNFNITYLNQVVHNLMLNSVKHSGVDNVLITLRTLLSDDGHYIYLDVLDNGVGVPPENQDFIFEPFYSTQNGTGLGLYLVREMCLSNQAKIEYVPQKKGACFRIIMECYLAEERAV